MVGAEGVWQEPGGKKANRYELALDYDAIHNITRKTQRHTVAKGQGQSNGNAQLQQRTSYDWQYHYEGHQPHAPTRAGPNSYRYDASGRQIYVEGTQGGKRRGIAWNAQDRVAAVYEGGSVRVAADGTVTGSPGNATRFSYDYTGQRATKTNRGHSAYVNAYFTLRNETLGTKHIFVGPTRLVSKVVPGNASYVVNDTPDELAEMVGQWSARHASGGHAYGRDWNNGQGHAYGRDTNNGNGNNGNGNNGNGNNGNGNNGNGNNRNGNGGTSSPYRGPSQIPSPAGLPEANFVFFYHADHLGSTGFITDADGETYEHVQYFPQGELWVEGHANNEHLPYLFTGKEYDAETGLYDFGARLYDPRLALWLSPDPALGRFLPVSSNEAGFLPGLGGVYSPVNLSLYNYAAHNGLIYVDPTGEIVDIAVDVASIVVGVASGAYHAWQGDWDAVKGDAVGVVIDVVAAAVPFVPGGVSIARKATKGAAAAADAGRIANRAADGAQAARQAGNAAEAGGSAARASTDTAASAAPRGGVGPVNAGKAGEAAARAQADLGIRERFFINGSQRISDGSTAQAIIEVKNVKHQPWTSQIRDYVDRAIQTDREFHLWVRRDTTFAPRLQEAINDKNSIIRLFYID